MGVDDREYMRQPTPDPEPESVEFVSCVASNRSEAERILKFACPTLGNDGRWYRCTLAVSNVPVSELYNVLSNMNFIAHNLREIAKTAPSEVGEQIRWKATQIESLHCLLKRGDHCPTGVFSGLNIHPPREQTDE